MSANRRRGNEFSDDRKILGKKDAQIMVYQPDCFDSSGLGLLYQAV